MKTEVRTIKFNDGSTVYYRKPGRKRWKSGVSFVSPLKNTPSYSTLCQMAGDRDLVGDYEVLCGDYQEIVSFEWCNNEIEMYVVNNKNG